MTSAVKILLSIAQLIIHTPNIKSKLKSLKPLPQSSCTAPAAALAPSPSAAPVLTPASSPAPVMDPSPSPAPAPAGPLALDLSRKWLLEVSGKAVHTFYILPPILCSHISSSGNVCVGPLVGTRQEEGQHGGLL